MGEYKESLKMSDFLEEASYLIDTPHPVAGTKSCRSCRSCGGKCYGCKRTVLGERSTILTNTKSSGLDLINKIRVILGE